MQDTLESFFSVVVVDARDNTPPNTGALKSALTVPCCNKRQLGGVSLAASVNDEKKKVTEQTS